MNLLSFCLGVLAGAGLFIVYGTYQIIKLKRAKSNILKKIKDKMDEINTTALTSVKNSDKGNSIKDRLMQAARLCETQNELRAQAELPSKNSLHSRHKNGLIKEVQDLEAQKISILKTVLGDGFDPMITVIKEGGVTEEILLSTYVIQSEEILNANLPPPSPESNNGPRKAGKFVIYNGGKNDDGTTH